MSSKRKQTNRLKWQDVQEKIQSHLESTCPKLCPPGWDFKTFRGGTLQRAMETFDGRIKEIGTEDVDRWLYRFCVRTALDERRWLVGRTDYKTCELKVYTSFHLVEKWDLKSDIDKALLIHARESHESFRSAKSVKLLFWNGYTEEELCRYWFDDYQLHQRNYVKRLVDRDCIELREILCKQLRLRPFIEQTEYYKRRPQKPRDIEEPRARPE